MLKFLLTPLLPYRITTERVFISGYTGSLGINHLTVTFMTKRAILVTKQIFMN